ncbi:MAG: M28 family peptidase [Lewinella sp.]|nr:M28 family peptidase [Lewinella sp.]
MSPYARLLAYALFLGILFTISSCGPDAPPSQPETRRRLSVPTFDRDSAYTYVEKQVNFGPRVVNSEGHRQCREWLVAKFEAMGATVIEQDFTAQAYTGETLNSTNIIAQYNPGATKRIVLAAHWDTRPIADSPLSTERTDEPILGADDGGSGVAVLLEVMRQLQLDTQQLEMGIDIVLFDAEDFGESGGESDTYGLGSQHWSRNIHTPHKPQFGILLDMVGARNAVFPVEGFSYRYAPNIVENIWRLAEQMGYGNYFRMEDGGGVTDDHYFVNTIAQIPMVDIINLPRTNEETAFGDHWHTHNDNMDIIDSRTLRAVGQVVLAVIYKEAQ